MSHFMTMVLVPPDTADIKAKVAQLLAPYDEDLAVPEYDTKCWCAAASTQRETTDEWVGRLGQLEVVDCDDCKGTGTRRTTRNPRSKWDWWRIGGRWDGDIQGNPRRTENGFNFGDDHSRPENNTAPVKDVLAQDPPFAIVTPDGEWHERGQMGWFATVSDEKDDWPVQARALLEKHMDCIAVACDLHV